MICLFNHLFGSINTNSSDCWDGTVAKQAGQLLYIMYSHLYVSIYCATSEIRVCFSLFGGVWDWDELTARSHSKF